MFSKLVLPYPGESRKQEQQEIKFDVTCFKPRLECQIQNYFLKEVSADPPPHHRQPDWEVYLTGGFIQHDSSMLTGPGTLHSHDFCHADWAFLSIVGITADQSKQGKRAMCRL